MWYGWGWLACGEQKQLWRWILKYKLLTVIYDAACHCHCGFPETRTDGSFMVLPSFITCVCFHNKIVFPNNVKFTHLLTQPHQLPVHTHSTHLAQVYYCTSTRDTMPSPCSTPPLSLSQTHMPPPQWKTIITIYNAKTFKSQKKSTETLIYMNQNIKCHWKCARFQVWFH